MNLDPRYRGVADKSSYDSGLESVVWFPVPRVSDWVCVRSELIGKGADLGSRRTVVTRPLRDK
jgi:hypothetical protein